MYIYHNTFLISFQVIPESLVISCKDAL